MSHRPVLREKDSTADCFIKAELMSAKLKQGEIDISYECGSQRLNIHLLLFKRT